MGTGVGIGLAADAARAAAAAPFARVEVATDPARALPAWRELEAAGSASAYQSSRFLLPWIETQGAAEGVLPFLATAYDDRDRPVALLPFGLSGRVIRVAGFLGGKHVNYAMGLFRPGVTWTPRDVSALLRAAARAGPVRPDAFVLANQPHAWDGLPNPLAGLRHQPSPSASHRTPLDPDPARFFAERQSRRTRKTLRGKREKLEAVGPVRHAVARTAEEVGRGLDAYLAQKTATLDGAGLPHDLGNPALRAFLHRLARPDGTAPPALDLHTLSCGDRIVATFGGLARSGRFSGLLISYDGAPEIARTSPGELLLAAVIEAKCRDGFASFDLGVGEARYKHGYCPVEDPLFDSFLPVTARGRLWALEEACRLRAKRWIKRSPRAWDAVGRLRTLGRPRRA